MAPVADAIKASHSPVVAHNRFAVDETGPTTQLLDRFDDEREAIGQIVAWSAVEPNLRPILPSNAPDSIVLDFVHPK
jgi:hypothetical protein